MARITNVTIIYLLVGYALIVSANECGVRERYSPELWNGDPLKLLAFTSDQDGFTCMLNFQRLDNYLFYDQIVLSSNGNKVIRTDHGNIEYLNIHSTLNATGWNEFMFSMDNSTFMVTVRDELVLKYTVEYPVKTITTYGSNISLCSSPSWAVGENEAIIIPLYTRLQDNDRDAFLNPNNSSIYFTLSSTASFKPIIKVDGIKRFLTMKNGEILLSQDIFQPLRLKKYLLEVHTQKQKVNINYKLGNNSKKLMEFQVATVLSDIEISSQGMSFTVDLDLNSILFTTTTTTTTDTITSTTPSVLVVATNDGTSTDLVVVIVVITILALMVALVIAIIIYKKHKISSMKTLSSGFHEETQHDNGSYRNNKSEMEKCIDDKNVISSHEQKQNYDGNYRSSIPEMLNLVGSKDETRLQEENHLDDGNCSKSANDLETLSENGEKASLQDENNSDDGNCSRSANDLETLSGNAERASDDMDGLEIPSERQSDLKDKSTCVESSENKDQDSGVLPPNELQSAIVSSPGNTILRDHPPPIDQRPSLPREDIFQGPLPHGTKPPHVALPHTAPPHVNPISSPPNSTPQPVAIQPHTYLSSSHSESRSDAPPELSQEEIDKRINLNTSVYSSAIDRSNTFIASGEYANAREALNNAKIMINQSKVGNDSRCMNLIGILQDNHNKINSKIDNIFNSNKTQHPHVPTSKADILDQLSLYEAPSAGYQFQFPQDNSSGNYISLPTHDSQSAGVLTQFYQNDYQQQELGSTGKRASTRRSNTQHHYVTTAMRFKDEMDQTQVKHEDIVKHLK